MLIEGLWVYVEEAARRKGVSEQAIRQALREGRIAGEKRRGQWLVDVRSLEEWTPIGHRPRKGPEE